MDTKKNAVDVAIVFHEAINRLCHGKHRGMGVHCLENSFFAEVLLFCINLQTGWETTHGSIKNNGISFLFFTAVDLPEGKCAR